MAMTGSGTDRTFGARERSRAKQRSAPRSLGAALREAGLGDAAPDPRDAQTREAQTREAPAGFETSPPVRSYGAQLSSAIAASRSPRLAVFAEPDETAEPAAHIVKPAPTTQGVVSPPPWLRAARRGRWHARMMNTFGWVMTLVVVGSIVGLAGHFLGLSPALEQAIVQARQ